MHRSHQPMHLMLARIFTLMKFPTNATDMPTALFLLTWYKCISGSEFMTCADFFFFWWLRYAHHDNITSRQQPQGQCEEDFLIMSSNRKLHGDSGINVFSTGAESRQDVVIGRERERKILVGAEVVSLIWHSKKSLIFIYIFKPSSK